MNSGQFFKDLFSEYPLIIEEKVKITYKWADLKEFDFKYCHNLFITIQYLVIKLSNKINVQFNTFFT